MSSVVVGSIKTFCRSVLPLTMRKRLALWIHSRTWIDKDRRQWWAQELLRDWEAADINSFHKFLWSHHLAYADTYELELRFGEENMKASRRMFFSDLEQHLKTSGVDPSKDIESAYEVGCSLGYQLRHLETDLFPNARRLEGVDIDQYAIDEGMNYLRSKESVVELQCGDMEELETFLGQHRYDIIICCGVLMYLKQADAARVVEKIMRRCNVMAAFSGLAHPTIDNSDLETSDVRPSDSTFIHNIDSLVSQAGGTVVARRWQGPELVDGNSIYFVFARK